MTSRYLLFVVMCAMLTATRVDGQQATTVTGQSPATADWRETLSERLPLFGHRNWIAIVDSAYPDQTSPGVETIATNEDQLQVARTVLQLLAHAKHVRPIVYVDAELAHVPEADAKGIEAYRK